MTMYFVLEHFVRENNTRIISMKKKIIKMYVDTQYYYFIIFHDFHESNFQIAIVLET